ncbi:MAG: hypothetical protein AVDCRST_MAG40-1980, partial [uncultured Gemmatimonadaceae bacterium]
ALADLPVRAALPAAALLELARLRRRVRDRLPHRRRRAGGRRDVRPHLHQLVLHGRHEHRDGLPRVAARRRAGRGRGGGARRVHADAAADVHRARAQARLPRRPLPRRAPAERGDAARRHARDPARRVPPGGAARVRGAAARHRLSLPVPLHRPAQRLPHDVGAVLDRGAQPPADGRLPRQRPRLLRRVRRGADRRLRAAQPRALEAPRP